MYTATERDCRGREGETDKIAALFVKLDGHKLTGFTFAETSTTATF